MEFPNIATAIRQHRNAKGISQSELSKLIGYKNGQFISNIERGLCSLPFEKIVPICKYISADPSVIREAMVADYHAKITEVIHETALL